MTMATRARFRTEADFTKAYPNSFDSRECRFADAIIRNKNIVDTFEQQPIVGGFNQAAGTSEAAEPASAQLLTFNSGRYPYELYYAAIETTGTAVNKVPTVTAAGLILPMDADQTDGPTAVEMTNGTTARSRACFTVGTDPDFFMEVSATITTITSVTELWAGFRKAEAYQADPDNYDEAACVNVGLGADGRFNITKILNNGATSTTTMGLTAWADAGTHTLRVEVARNGKCRFFVDGTESVAAAHTFDAGEVVVPFLHLDGETGDAVVALTSWKVGRL